MKKIRTHSVRINLLPEKNLDIREKLLFFALHYLRYIIVLTQTTVILVFFYRFQIDQAIIDLREDVSQKQEILKITAPLVSEAQTTQARISHVKTIMAGQSSFTNLFDFVLSHIPADITLNEFSLDGKNMTIKGQSLSISAIQMTYKELGLSDTLKKVEVVDINKSAETGIFEFIITALYE